MPAGRSVGAGVGSCPPQQDAAQSLARPLTSRGGGEMLCKIVFYDCKIFELNSPPSPRQTNHFFFTVLGIRDILVRIRMRILGSVPLTDGSGCVSGMPKNIRILRIRIRMRIRYTGKKSYRSYKQKKSRFFLLFLLDDGWIWSRIWIRRYLLLTDPDPQQCFLYSIKR